MLKLAWMIFCVTWGAFQFDTLYGKHDASQAEVNSVITWAIAPYVIGRALAREVEFQKYD